VRVAGRSGTWVPGDERGPDRKVGAIGARVARGATMHGFALNADCDLSWYDRIVPCGIRDAGTTTLSAETGRDITVAEVMPVMKRQLADVLGYRTWRHVYDVGILAGPPLEANTLPRAPGAAAPRREAATAAVEPAAAR
jgi:lipoate-protein ligase B